MPNEEPEDGEEGEEEEPPPPPPSWDREWKSRGIDLNRKVFDTATANSEFGYGQSVRLAWPVPKEGVHSFEYLYTRPGKGLEGATLGDGYMVGVVKSTVPKELFAERGGVAGSGGFWGMQDTFIGSIYEGEGIKPHEGGDKISVKGLTGYVPPTARNTRGQAFGSGDKIGFVINMEEGTMKFYRNGETMEGTEINNIPTHEEEFWVVGCPYDAGSSVKISLGETVPPELLPPPPPPDEDEEGEEGGEKEK